MLKISSDKQLVIINLFMYIGDRDNIDSTNTHSNVYDRSNSGLVQEPLQNFEELN
jgi:hypothetical protein